MQYKRGFLRKLIEDNLTAPELEKSLDDFSDVRNQLTDGQAQNLRNNIILDYFEKHQEDKFPDFLEAIKQHNCTAYNNYISQLNNSANRQTPSLSDLKEENLDSEFIDKLEPILPQQDDLFWQCANQVYQDFLLQNEPDLEPESDNLSREYLLSELKDRSDEQIILEFVPRLVAYLSTKYRNEYHQCVQNLRKITKQHIDSSKLLLIDEFNTALSNFKQEYKTSLGRYYLIIEIKKSQSYPNLFQIYGWLAKNNTADDLRPLKNQQLRVETEENNTQEQYYTQENIKEVVRNFIAQSSNESEGKDLIIEFFLPSSLFGWEVDRWKFDPADKIYLGIVHEVRIRSLDRLKPMYNPYKNRWKTRWKYLEKCVSLLPEFLNGDFNGDVNTLVGQLQNQTIVGLKLTSALKSSHEEVASALYYSGTPIALWFRSEPPEGDCKTELDNLLEGNLLQLSMRVLQKRCQSERHISLIWDDPNRLIPTYQLK